MRTKSAYKYKVKVVEKIEIPKNGWYHEISSYYGSRVLYTSERYATPYTCIHAAKNFAKDLQGALFIEPTEKDKPKLEKPL